MYRRAYWKLSRKSSFWRKWAASQLPSRCERCHYSKVSTPRTFLHSKLLSRNIISYDWNYALRRWDVGALGILHTILMHFHARHSHLGFQQAQLCDKLFQEMNKHFEQGATHWNWAALALADYANTLSDAVGHFGGVVSQINKIGRDVRFRVLEMKNVVLFKEPPYKTASYELPIFDCWVTAMVNIFFAGSLHCRDRKSVV